MKMGYVKLYRKFTEWEWYKEPNMAHFFVHLLIKANHKNQNWRGIEIKKGQLVTGRNSLCNETGISAQSIRTCLNRLKSTNEITIKPTKQFSIITLCNFEKYQLKQPTIQPTIQPTSNQRATNEQPTTNHKQECIKNVKNKENVENEKKNNTNSHIAEKVFSADSQISSSSQTAEPIREKKETPLYKKMVDYYFEWYEKKFRMKPDFDGSDGRALKSIITYFGSQPDNAGDEKIYATWTTLLSNFNKWDKFHQTHTRVRQINAVKSNIINYLKNGKSGEGTNESLAAALEEHFRKKYSTTAV